MKLSYHLNKQYSTRKPTENHGGQIKWKSAFDLPPHSPTIL